MSKACLMEKWPIKSLYASYALEVFLFACMNKYVPNKHAMNPSIYILTTNQPTTPVIKDVEKLNKNTFSLEMPPIPKS